MNFPLTFANQKMTQVDLFSVCNSHYTREITFFLMVMDQNLGTNNLMEKRDNQCNIPSSRASNFSTYVKTNTGKKKTDAGKKEI